MLWFGFLYNSFGVLTLIYLWIRSYYHDYNSDHDDPLLLLQSPSPQQQQEEDTTEQQDHVTVHNPIITNSLVTYILIMMIHAILALVPSPSRILSSFTFQIISLLSAIVCGISGAYLGIGIVTFTCTFSNPNWSIGPYITGQAMGGMILSTLDLWMKYHFDDDATMSTINISTNSNIHVDMGTFVYFMIGSCFLFLCLYLYHWLVEQQSQRMDFNVVTSNVITSTRINPTDTEQGEIILLEQNDDLSEPLLPSCSSSSTNRNDDSHDGGGIHNDDDHNDDDIHNHIQRQTWNRLKPVAISIFTCFFITITIFPSWITELKSIHANDSNDDAIYNRWTHDLYIPLLIVLFNTFDFIGRTMVGYTMKKMTLTSLSSISTVMQRYKMGSMFRMALLPLFWFLNHSSTTSSDTASTTTTTTIMTTIFKSDTFAMILSMIFAFTNGWISTGGFILANLALSHPFGGTTISSSSTPTMTTTTTTTTTTTNNNNNNSHHGTTNINHHNLKKWQEAASVILNFSVGLGLFGGSLCSFLFHWIGTRMIHSK
jgi:hypothetical protein